MVRDNLKDFNIMEHDEYILGFYEEIIKYFKEVAKDYIDKLDITEYESVNEIIDLLQDLDKAYDRGELGDDDLLEIGYNPMGAYTFCRWEREKESDLR